MQRLSLKFQLNEMLLLVFELYLFVAGIVMVVSAITGSTAGLHFPADSLTVMLPGVMTVGFATWLVYRLRCLRQARARGWAMAGALCLSLVAISFGAAVGKLNMIHMSAWFQESITEMIHDPLLKRASLASHLAFLSVGTIFGLLFIAKAAKGPFTPQDRSQELHNQLSQLSQKIVRNWSESLVAKVDAFLECGEVDQAIEYYRKKTRCTEDTSAIVIADWLEQRLVLQVEQLNRTIVKDSEQRRRPVYT
ncbi:MAG: hypothetical protein VB858_09080 [Planctomycetaceae bacterium]